MGNSTPAPLDLALCDAAALRAMVLEQRELLALRDAQIEGLHLLIIQFRRRQFGRRSEKLDSKIAQLELQLEELEA